VRVNGIDHINISGPIEKLEECIRFYTDVLGLSQGYRPPFSSRGFWLYAGDAPIIHLTEMDANGAPFGGPLNHVAFACEHFESVEARLRARDVPFTVDHVPMTSQVQIFLKDPAGVALELNFDDVTSTRGS